MATLSTVFTGQDPHSTNPRRCPASNSISLPAPKKLKVSHPPAADDATPPAIRMAHLRQNSSGDSASDTSASRWFDNANQVVALSWKDAADFDTEPPFFISNQAPYNPNPRFLSHSEHLFGAVYRDDSENEDLRGVIDDLTIENKRLKQNLRSERRRHKSSTTNGEKLFEVRMHGLAPEKKRELELLLKNFATSMQSGISRIHDATASRTSANPDLNDLPTDSPARDPNMKRPPTDSGYGSNSGLVSAAHSNGGWWVLPVSQANKDKTVKTYLHDIPDVLHPRRPLIMSERSKMALVVRRLEQLFTGKHAVPGEHSQPIQQQEISQSAARADLQANLKKNKKLHTEGTREAHMLPHNSGILDSAERQQTPPKKVDEFKEISEFTDRLLIPESSAASNNGAISPDQRPTRPLDLDIERQIIPSESINYLRHLGLQSPHVEDVNGDKEGWMYLNLLNNMAQLHSTNVTPEFIRRSIKKRSTKFELSKDGHQVRWIGGPGRTIFSDEEERLLEAVNLVPSSSTDETLKPSGGSHTSKTASSNAFTPATRSGSPHKQMSDSSNQLELNFATSEWPQGTRQSKTQPVSAFDYQPIMFSTKISSTTDSNVGSSNSSDDPDGLHSNGLVQGSKKAGLKRPHADEGLIIFYAHSPYFCSDFSGDFAPLKGRQKPFNDHEAILGVSSRLDVVESPLRYHDACYFTPQFAVHGFDETEDEIPSFLPSPISAAGQSETEPIELRASGLGGVMPEDNFALDVKVERIRIASPKQRSQHRRFVGRQAKARYEYHIIETNQLNLQPSQLPSPSYLAFASSSSEAIDTLNLSEDSDDSSSTDEEVVEARLTFGLLSPDYLDESSEGSSDESVDMLRAARAAEPEVVAAQEREFLINQPWGGERVPGSLAVTVGTRSCGLSDGEDSASELDDDDSDSDTE